MVLAYYKKEKLEENIKKFVEGAQNTLQCRWTGKPEQTSPQKHPHIIDALCKFCLLLKEKTNTCKNN